MELREGQNSDYIWLFMMKIGASNSVCVLKLSTACTICTAGTFSYNNSMKLTSTSTVI